MFTECCDPQRRGQAKQTKTHQNMEQRKRIIRMMEADEVRHGEDATIWQQKAKYSEGTSHETINERVLSCRWDFRHKGRLSREGQILST